MPKHINITFYDENQKDIHALVSRLINEKKMISSNSDLLRINIGHKLIRILKEIRFAQDNIINYQKLTHREKEIIKLLAQGMNNPRIAKQLFISRYTVEQHRKNINSKLSIKSFPQLMSFVYAFDFV